MSSLTSSPNPVAEIRREDSDKKITEALKSEPEFSNTITEKMKSSNKLSSQRKSSVKRIPKIQNKSISLI
jgi:hypothetical protein